MVDLEEDAVGVRWDASMVSMVLDQAQERGCFGAWTRFLRQDVPRGEARERYKDSQGRASCSERVAMEQPGEPEMRSGCVTMNDDSTVVDNNRHETTW